MRIRIEHEEVRAGVLLKTPYHKVRSNAEFTHEENQIVRQRRLEDPGRASRVTRRGRR